MREKLEELARDLEDTEDGVNPNSYEMGFNDGKRLSGRKLNAILATPAPAPAALRDAVRAEMRVSLPDYAWNDVDEMSDRICALFEGAGGLRDEVGKAEAQDVLRARTIADLTTMRDSWRRRWGESRGG